MTVRYFFAVANGSNERWWMHFTPGVQSIKQTPQPVMEMLKHGTRNDMNEVYIYAAGFFSPVFCVSFDFIWLMKCCISLDLVKSNHFFYSGRTRWERNKYYTCTTQIDGVGVAQKPFPVFFCLRRGLRCAVHIHLFYSTENYCASAITNVIKYVNLSTLK